MRPQEDFIEQTMQPEHPLSALYFIIGRAWRDTGLNPYEFTVLANLASHAGSKGTAWPSIRTIAKETRISVAKVVTTLKSLESKKFVTHQRREKNGIKSSNIYTIIAHPKTQEFVGGMPHSSIGGVLPHSIPCATTWHTPVLRGSTEGIQDRRITREDKEAPATRERSISLLKEKASPKPKIPAAVSPYVASPPTDEEVRAYCIKRGISPTSGAKQILIWADGDWKYPKGNPVLSWKQGLLTRHESGWLPGQNGSNGTSQKSDSYKTNHELTQKEMYERGMIQ